MSFPTRMIEVREESERGWEDAAARAVVNLGHELIKNIDSLNLDSSRETDDHREQGRRYLVEASISLTCGPVAERSRIAR